ncbi:hypothetical protein UlMin_033135 [Ulmus minor]
MVPNFIILFLSTTNSPVTIRLINSCPHTIWPEIATNPQTTITFPLGQGESKNVFAAPNWSGTIWGRTLCTPDATGALSCATGDCIASSSCPPPTTTVAEFGLNFTEYGQYCSYSVSLVRGFNLPLTVVPYGGTGKYCRATGCVVDLNQDCPEELRVLYGNGVVVGCNSACEAGDCSGNFRDYFESSCPRARSLVSDMTNSFVCLSAEYYDLVFCASSFPPTLPPPPGGTTTWPPEESDFMNDKSKGSKSTILTVILSILGIITVGGGLAWKWKMVLHCLCVCATNCSCCNNCCNNWFADNSSTISLVRAPNRGNNPV